MVKTYITVSLQSLGMKIKVFFRVCLVQNYLVNNHCTATSLLACVAGALGGGFGTEKVWNGES